MTSSALGAMNKLRFWGQWLPILTFVTSYMTDNRTLGNMPQNIVPMIGRAGCAKSCRNKL